MCGVGLRLPFSIARHCRSALPPRGARPIRPARAGHRPLSLSRRARPAPVTSCPPSSAPRHQPTRCLLFEKRLDTKFLILRSARMHVRRHLTHFFTQTPSNLRLLAQYFSQFQVELAMSSLYFSFLSSLYSLFYSLTLLGYSILVLIFD